VLQIASMDDSAKRGLFGGMQIVFVACAAFAVYCFVTVAKEAEHRRSCTPTCLIHPDYAGADRLAPDFALKDMKGRDVKLSDYRGRVVFLNFWTKNCGPCLKEMPSVAELAHMVADRKDVVVLAVSTDEGPSDVADVLKSILREEPPFPVLFDPDGDKVVVAKFGTHLFPETWLIDKRGVIRARFDGGRDWANPAVVELLDQLREGSYCPLRVDKSADRDGKEAESFCAPMLGG
jgi:peroxiredoxin